MYEAKFKDESFDREENILLFITLDISGSTNRVIRIDCNGKYQHGKNDRALPVFSVLVTQGVLGDRP